MKYSILISILILMGASAQAIRHVGNGGGVSEQNVVFAFENAKTLLESCLQDCELNLEEKSILRDFVASTQVPQATLHFHQDKCRGFEVTRYAWNICLPQLLLNGRDRDLDGFLNLGESLVLLLRMDTDAKGVFSATTDALVGKITQILNQQSFNFVFQMKKEQFHIFGYRDVLMQKMPIFVQSEDVEVAVSLWPLLTEGLLCTEFDLSHPYVTEQYETDEVQRFVVVFPLTLFCGSEIQGISKLKILSIEMTKGKVRVY